MKSFIPAAKDDAQAEEVYAAICKFNNAPLDGPRIAALHWTHNGKPMSAAVGKELPAYYQTGGEPVVAILDCGQLYKVCTENRGVIRGEAVLCGKEIGTTAIPFTE